MNDEKNKKLLLDLAATRGQTLSLIAVIVFVIATLTSVWCDIVQIRRAGLDNCNIGDRVFMILLGSGIAILFWSLFRVGRALAAFGLDRPENYPKPDSTKRSPTG